MKNTKKEDVLHLPVTVCHLDAEKILVLYISGFLVVRLHGRKQDAEASYLTSLKMTPDNE